MSKNVKQCTAASPMPKYADRETCAAIVSHFHFPVMPRTIATWPLIARRPNGRVVYKVEEVLEFASQKFKSAPVYKQA